MNCQGCGKPIEPVCGRAVPVASDASTGYPPPVYSGPVPTRFVRPREGRVVAGVCAGLALAYGWDVTVVRLVVAVLILCAGVPLLLYIIAWIVMPNADYTLPPPPPAGAIVS